MFNFFKSSSDADQNTTIHVSNDGSLVGAENEDSVQLTQFPAYGSNQCNDSDSENHNNGNNDDEDLILNGSFYEEEYIKDKNSHASCKTKDVEDGVVLKKTNALPGNVNHQRLNKHNRDHNQLITKDSEYMSAEDSAVIKKSTVVSWMPDELCKTCYACNVEFTVFRRRHHCRMCGQVFCSTCSAYTLESKQLQQIHQKVDDKNTLLSGNRLRVCKMCFDHTTTNTVKLIAISDENISSVAQENKESEYKLNTGRNLSSAVVVNGMVNPHGQILTSISRHSHSSFTDPNDISGQVLSTNQKLDLFSSAEPPSSKLRKRLNNDTATKRQLGQVAADQLEVMCENLLRQEIGLASKEWCNIILSLATQCCRTVKPTGANIKNATVQRGPMDIRSFVKVKIVPGGNRADCNYISGIIFQKNVMHKYMAKELVRPRILLLSGAIDYTRSTNENTYRGIVTLDGIRDAEEMFLRIFMNKILTLKPTLILVGKAISRRAQELLLEQRIVAIQHVKQTTLDRISLQTGALILNSNDVIHMNPSSELFRDENEESPVGVAESFRLVTYRDNSVKHQPYRQPSAARSAKYAALLLGEAELNGSHAIQSGLAKRGIARTYSVIDGCPEHLGCTVTLRGLSSRDDLKKLKRVFLFMTHVAYNLKLETAYLRERFARLPPSYRIDRNEEYNSSSLCVDYGKPPPGRKNKPWNGLMGSNNKELAQKNATDGESKSMDDSSDNTESSALDHQSILITSVWMTGKTQCCPAEVKGISYYTKQDVSLGQFLRDSCFNLNLKCQNPACKKTVIEHTLSFIHNDGQVNITVENMDEPLPPRSFENTADPKDFQKFGDISKNGSVSVSTGNNDSNPIATWTCCNKCGRIVTPLVYISSNTWMYSFGKFLEVYFYNNVAQIYSTEHRCTCPMQTATTLVFGCGKLAARFTYSKVDSYGVYVRRHLPFDSMVHRQDSLNQLSIITSLSNLLFSKFHRHIDKVSRETRSMFASAANQPENLQALLSELNVITSQVEAAAIVIQARINSVMNLSNSADTNDEAKLGDWKERFEQLLNLPSLARRYLFILLHSFNDRLSAIGQTLVAMRKLSSVLRKYGPDFNGSDGETRKTLISDIMEGMHKLRQMQEFYSKFDINDITFSASNHPGEAAHDDINNRRLPRYHTRPSRLDADYQEFDDEIEYDDEEEIVSNTKYKNKGRQMQFEGGPPINRVKKSSGSRRYDDGFDFDSSSNNARLSVTDLKASKTNPTPGGAVKSALNRFFNRSAKELDPYVIDLGELGEGRLRLEPGVGDVIVPILDDQPATIIAHSLASTEYNNQFREFAMVVDGVASSNGSYDSSRRDKGSMSRNGPNDKALFTPHQQSTNLQSESRDSLVNMTSSEMHMDNNVDKIVSNQPSWISLERKEIERRMLSRTKTHIKHSWRDTDAKGNSVCKFVCTSYWAIQFQAVRQAFMGSSINPSSKDFIGVSNNDKNGYISATEIESHFVLSLSRSQKWAASGGKSGAAFSRSVDEMFVIKSINRTELQMFLDCAPSYFEYMSKSFFHGLPTVLCKILGVYQIGYHNRVTGKRTMEQVAVMQNMFYGRNISQLFDLKGSLRGRFTQGAQGQRAPTTNSASDNRYKSRARNRNNRMRRNEDDYSDDSDDDSNGYYSSSTSSSGIIENTSDDDEPNTSSGRNQSNENIANTATGGMNEESVSTLLDGDFIEFTSGRPLPLNDRAKAVFHMSILNDTLFLSIINVLDYSILVGIDSDRMELVVGIIDFMRQYDILKQMERVGKSIPMVVGQEAPTIIQPPLYKQRFTNAMERYFMTVPNKWTSM